MIKLNKITEIWVNAKHLLYSIFLVSFRVFLWFTEISTNNICVHVVTLAASHHLP